jgi:hypothetical protein
VKPATEKEFLVRLAAIWLACRLSVMGGTPEDIPQCYPVRDMPSLAWAMLGCVDSAYEMKLICKEELCT